MAQRIAETKELVEADFKGKSINKQNLSDWRKGGYAEWRLRCELVEHAQELKDEARELRERQDSFLMADDLVTVFTARYAALLRRWDGEVTEAFSDKVRVFSRIRRAPHTSLWLRHRKTHQTRSRAIGPFHLMPKIDEPGLQPFADCLASYLWLRHRLIWLRAFGPPNTAFLWSLYIGASLELGCWRLEFTHAPFPSLHHSITPTTNPRPNFASFSGNAMNHNIAMKRPCSILLFTLAGILLLTFGWFVLRPREPSYQGRTLTQWLQEAKDQNYYYPDSEAFKAILHIGSNAVPTLLSYVAAKDSPLKLSILNWNNHHTRFNLKIRLQSDKQSLAAQGFYILGADAQCAVPELIRLLKDDDENVRMNAAGSLGCIGAAAQPAVPDLIKEFEREMSVAKNQEYLAALALGWIGPSAQAAIPSLKNGLTNNSPSCRRFSQAALINIHAVSISTLLEELKDTTNFSQWDNAQDTAMQCRTNALAAVPLLIAALNCTNGNIQLGSLSALSWLHLEPEACVPAIIPLLSSKDDYLRQNAVDVLRSFGASAKPAVPALFHCLDGPNYSLREHATNALRVIDPEAAAKAGIK